MDIEQEIKVIPVDDKLTAELAKFAQEGWLPAPGVKPVAVYHLVRIRSPQTVTDIDIKPKITIDDSKVGIIRGDKFIKADGTEVALSDMPKGEQ